MTIEQAQQLLEQASRRDLSRELALLAAISQEFAASPALDETLTHAIGQVMAYLEAEAASIFLLDETGKTLTCVACAGPVAIKGLSLAAGQGIVGRAVTSNAVQMVRDVAADADFSADIDTQTGFRTRSILCAPLGIKRRMLGALEVINKRSGDQLFGDSDKHLLQALAGMVSLAVHNARMAEALVEQERLRREIDLAREIQRGLLPATPGPVFPVCGLNLPAREVSGDFYDFFRRPDGCIVWGLGDVSGKGMNAALLMAKTISLFRGLGKRIEDPAELLALLNDEIAETARFGMFVTMVAGRYDPAADCLSFANAGHLPPLCRDRNGDYREIEDSGPPLGVLPGMRYETLTLSLDGGRLYLFTDGVTEGRDAAGDMLELAGLKALIENHPGEAAAQLAAVAAALARPGERLHDDLTLLVVGRPASDPLLFERDFPALPSSLAELRAELQAACQQAGCGEDCTAQIVLAANEAGMNIIQHGYGFAADRSFRLRVLRSDDRLQVQLLDNARAASLSDLCPREIEDLRPGGLGVRFMREVMDRIEYLPAPAGYTNLLQLSKRIV